MIPCNCRYRQRMNKATMTAIYSLTQCDLMLYFISSLPTLSCGLLTRKQEGSTLVWQSYLSAYDLTTVCSECKIAKPACYLPSGMTHRLCVCYISYFSINIGRINNSTTNIYETVEINHFQKQVISPDMMSGVTF